MASCHILWLRLIEKASVSVKVVHLESIIKKNPFASTSEDTMPDATVDYGDHRDEIVRLEERIDELAESIERCRKFSLAGRIVVLGGGSVLIPMVIGATQIDLSVMAVSMTAILGGVVVAGTNRSTAQEAMQELAAAETRRTTLIEQIDLRLVPDRDGRQ